LDFYFHHRQQGTTTFGYDVQRLAEDFNPSETVQGAVSTANFEPPGLLRLECQGLGLVVDCSRLNLTHEEDN
jgi:hypothetical protein